MAIRYVKDFEFPAAAGFTSSTPNKVTGQMLAKGGKVKNFDGGGMYGEGETGPYDINNMQQPPSNVGKGALEGGRLGAISDRERRMMMMQASKRQAEIAKQAQEQGAMSDADWRMMQRGYKKGGKVDSVPVKDIKSGKIPQSTDEDFYGKAEDMPMPTRRPAGMKKGGMKHDDAAQDKAMIKNMIKPSALKKADGGMAQKVQMAKSDAIEDSLKGQKKTGYADGGMPPQMRAALAKKANSVPVAPRTPMIPQQEMPARGALASIGEGGIGVGQSRPNKPNIGALRAAMAKKASMAMPENAPSMMKKGGKVMC
jgi:hypothetical protein